MNTRSLSLAVALIFGCVVCSWAQLKSGPEPGIEITGFSVHVVTGDFAGKDVDFIKEKMDKTTVFLFVSASNWTRPVARYLKTLDDTLSKNPQGSEGVDVVAVWLTDAVDKAKDYLPKAQQSLKLQRTAFAVYPGATQGPNGWGIDTEAHLTTVIVQKGKVQASFGYRSTNETDVPEVLKVLQIKTD